MRGVSVALVLVGGLAQLTIAFLGDAIGGLSVTVVLLGIDALLAIVGGAAIFKWSRFGLFLTTLAAVGALVLLFWTTWLEIGVGILLLGGAGAALISIQQGKPPKASKPRAEDAA